MKDLGKALAQGTPAEIKAQIGECVEDTTHCPTRARSPSKNLPRRVLPRQGERDRERPGLEGKPFGHRLRYRENREPLRGRSGSAPSGFESGVPAAAVAKTANTNTSKQTAELSFPPSSAGDVPPADVRVAATVVAEDNFDPNPAVRLVSVTSNEPDNGKGDGNTRDDIVIVDGYHFKLRAERSGKGGGRTYTITYEATDACGNSSTATATVTVPKSQGRSSQVLSGPPLPCGSGPSEPGHHEQGRSKQVGQMKVRAPQRGR